MPSSEPLRIAKVNCKLIFSLEEHLFYNIVRDFPDWGNYEKTSACIVCSYFLVEM